MSSYSYKIKDRNKVKDIYDKELLDQADKHIFKRRFDLGTGYQKDYTEHILKVLSMVCSENCDFNDYFDNALKVGRQDVTNTFTNDIIIIEETE